jgi:hypothetical protein
VAAGCMTIVTAALLLKEEKEMSVWLRLCELGNDDENENDINDNIQKPVVNVKKKYLYSMALYNVLLWKLCKLNEIDYCIILKPMMIIHENETNSVCIWLLWQPYVYDVIY